MVDQASPLGPAYNPGLHGNLVGSTGVVLSEVQPGSIVQLTAWPGREQALLSAVADVSDLTVPDLPGGGVAENGRAAFGIGPGRYLVVDPDEDLYARYAAAILHDTGAVTDLSHGRTALRVAGPKAEWVLSKLFAIDFSPAAFPVGRGISTMHHDVFAQIQRTSAMTFELYVFRSFARSFWRTLCHAAEEVGYEVS